MKLLRLILLLDTACFLAHAKEYRPANLPDSCQPKRIAITGAGPAGVLSALLLINGTRVDKDACMRVDLYEKHTAAECKVHRSFWVDFPGKAALVSWGLNDLDIQKLEHDYVKDVEEISYCSLVGTLLEITKRHAHEAGASFELNVLRPATFESDMADQYDWVIDASGRHRTMFLPTGDADRNTAIEFTPAKLALDVSWQLSYTQDQRNVATTNERLAKVLSKLDSVWLTDLGHTGVGEHHYEIIGPHPDKAPGTSRGWVILLGRAEEVPGETELALSGLVETAVPADRYFQRHANLTSLKMDVQLLTEAIREYDPTAVPVLNARVMQEVVSPNIAWNLANNKTNVVLVGESAWAKDTPYYSSESLPAVCEQAEAAVKSVLNGDVTEYQRFMSASLGRRVKELGQLRQELATSDNPDHRALRVIGRFLQHTMPVWLPSVRYESLVQDHLMRKEA